MLILDLPDEQASERIARTLAALLIPPLIITFSGDLGTGKTTIIRAILRHLGVNSAIKSPTFSLVESYLCQDIGFFDNSSAQSLSPATCSRDPESLLTAQDYCSKLDRSGSHEQVARLRFMNSQQGLVVHHFDLYRIHDEDELEYLGFRDYFSKDSICCIEWPENAGKFLPKEDIHFKLDVKGAGREMQITASSDTGKRILARLAGEL